jgi:hypothetical protein
MSDQIVKEVIPDPTTEEKIVLLTAWSTKVETEIAGYTAERDKLYAAYKKQKDMYDHWLGIKMKKIKKYDVVLNERKKVHLDIKKELVKLAAMEAPKNDVQLSNSPS